LAKENEQLVNDASKDLIIEGLLVELDVLADEKNKIADELASYKTAFELYDLPIGKD
jgi:hypothetical protein